METIVTAVLLFCFPNSDLSAVWIIPYCGLPTTMTQTYNEHQLSLASLYVSIYY